MIGYVSVADSAVAAGVAIVLDVAGMAVIVGCARGGLLVARRFVIVVGGTDGFEFELEFGLVA